MRKRLLVAVFVLAIVSILNTPICAKPCDEVRLGQNEALGYYINPYPEPTQIRCTCYTLTGTMKNGKQTHYGAIAGREEDLGKTAILYDIAENGGVGNLIGIFEFEDTGSFHTLKEGTSVDVWRPSLEEAYDWTDSHGDYVYIQIVDSKG